MLFNLATLVLPLMFFGGITTATPLEARDTTVIEAPGVDVSKLKVPAPTTATGSKHKSGAPVPGSTTSPNSAFHGLAGTAVDQFVICSEGGCSGNCIGYALSSLEVDVCYEAGEYYTTFYIYQESNTGLPYTIYVGEANCSYPSYVPRVNTCYDSPGSGGSPRTLETFYRN